jgi:RNA polymerase sigma-70 factor, ECF subfamily
MRRARFRTVDPRRFKWQHARVSESMTDAADARTPGTAGTPGGANVDDAQLVAAMARGERAALAALYDRYASLLLGAAYHVLRNRRDAEDLLHDVLLECWNKAATYEARRGSVRSWLLVRVRSRALDRVRSLAVARRHAAAPPAPEEAPLAGDALRAADGGRAIRALGALPEAQRSIVELCFFQGLGCAEIAKQLGIPVGTVKSRLARAVERLRGELGVEGAG